MSPSRRVPPPGTDWRLVDIWYDEMTAALVECYGAWVVGWPYSVEMEEIAGRSRIPAWRREHPPITTPSEVPAGAADLARLIHGMTAATHRRWLRQRVAVGGVLDDAEIR
ncbi:hypothetical protein AB0B31_20955 [Catellatospora citrea]|uniref:hypothetical protein n=1 Tax=Catellatospora citrea TaxID=53366 RepID=UPI0033C77B0B